MTSNKQRLKWIKEFLNEMYNETENMQFRIELIEKHLKRFETNGKKKK
jgi:hypothetical protein